MDELVQSLAPGREVGVDELSRNSLTNVDRQFLDAGQSELRKVVFEFLDRRIEVIPTIATADDSQVAQ